MRRECDVKSDLIDITVSKQGRVMIYAQDIIDAHKAEIARLRAELAEYKATYQYNDADIDVLNDKHAEEIARLREALGPFADAHQDLLENWGREDFVLVSLARIHRDVCITIADFGRARAALAPRPSEEAE